MTRSNHKGKKPIGDLLRKRRLAQAGGTRYADTSSIMVAKELVLLEDANVSQNSLYDRIQFTNNYVPKDGFKVNNIKHSVEDCKKIFKITFGGEVALNIDYPYLPCSNTDNGVASGIISQGLRHRFTTLAQEIILLESTQKDTAALRTKLGQLDALRELINAIAVSPKCYDYVNQTDSSKVAENLENAQWEAMLRTFATIYLIAKDKAAIGGAPGSLGKKDAVTMIDTISSQQITDEQLRKYYDAWTAKSENKDKNIRELLDYLKGVPQAALVKATEEKARVESKLKQAQDALDAAETAKNEATTALAAAAGESAAKLADLQKQLTDLSGVATDLADVRAELGDAQRELRETASNLETTTSELKAAQEKNGKSDAEVAKVNAELATAKAVAAKAAADATTAAATAAAAAATAATALAGERDAAVAAATKAQQEATAAQAKAGTAEEARAAAEAARNAAEKEQERLQTATTAAEAMLAAAENALKDAQTGSEKALAKVKADLKTAVEATTSATAEGKELREKLDNAVKSADDTQTQLNTLTETTTAAAAAATRELEAQKKLTEAARDELAEAKRGLAKAEVEQKAAAHAADAKIKELQAQISALDPTIQAKLTEVKKQLEEARGKLGKTMAELGQANASKDEAEKKFAEIQPKIIDLQEKLRIARLEEAEATTALADLTAAAAARREPGDAIATQDAEAEQTAAENRLAAAVKAKGEAEARVAAAEAEQQSLRDRVNALAKIANSAQSENMAAQASAAAAAAAAAAALKKAAAATAEEDPLRAQLEAAQTVATQTEDQLNISQSATAIAAKAEDNADIATQTMSNIVEGVDASVATPFITPADVAAPVQPATAVPTLRTPAPYNKSANEKSVNQITSLLQKKGYLYTGQNNSLAVGEILINNNKKNGRIVDTFYNNILMGDINITNCDNSVNGITQRLYHPLYAAGNAWKANWELGNTEQEIVAAAQAAFKRSLGSCIKAGTKNKAAADKLATDMNPYLERYILAILNFSVQLGGGDSYEELADNVVSTLEESLMTCDEDLSICEKEKEEHRQRIEELHATIASLQAELRSQMSNTARVSQDLAAKAADFDETLEDPTEDYKAFIADSQAKFANTDTQLKEKRLQIKELASASAAADKKAEEAAALITELKGIIAKLKPASLKGGGAVTHPLMALSAAISEAAANLLPK